MKSLKRRGLPVVSDRSDHHAAGFSLIELIVVIAAIVILAAAIAPLAFSWVDQGKAARAQSDSTAIAVAMNRFFQDTTRWPGQVEILKSESSARFLTVGDASTAEFPATAGSVGIEAATCSSGLSGVTANATAFGAATPSAANSLNILHLLLEPPSSGDYPNWRGPYLPPGLSADPWGTVFVVNIIPLFCGESVSAGAPGGALGFGWILSGGPNRTIQTPFTAAQINDGSDDVGVNLSKRMTPDTLP